jgi:urease accessory protein
MAVYGDEDICPCNAFSSGIMQTIDHIVSPKAQGASPIIDRIALTWEQRQKSRQKLQTAQGQEIALALPTGTRLQAGDLLPTAEGWIEVQLAPEDILLIRPRSLQETAFVAYQIGNRHLPLEIADQSLKTPYEPILETYLRQQSIPLERAQLPFTPVSAWAQLERLDRHITAMKHARELREATMKTGQRLLRLAMQVWPGPAIEHGFPIVIAKF